MSRVPWTILDYRPNKKRTAAAMLAWKRRRARDLEQQRAVIAKLHTEQHALTGTDQFYFLEDALQRAILNRQKHVQAYCQAALARVVADDDPLLTPQ
jgi:hypothetical protein